MKEESRPKWFALFYGFTKSTIWFVLFFSFSIFLIFGPAIQSLIDTGTAGDLVFLYLRTIMLFFFTMDMLLRCVAEENYFSSTAVEELDTALDSPPHNLKILPENFTCDLKSVTDNDLEFSHMTKLNSDLSSPTVENSSTENVR